MLYLESSKDECLGFKVLHWGVGLIFANFNIEPSVYCIIETTLHLRQSFWVGYFSLL